MKKTNYEGRTFIYRMNKEQAEDIYTKRNDHDRKAQFKQYLIDYVNSQYGLLRPCSDIELF